jgi:hypothetical protein
VETTLEVLNIPLNILTSWESLGELADIIILTAHENYTVWVDVLLEFWFQQFFEFLLVDGIFLSRH